MRVEGCAWTVEKEEEEAEKLEKNSSPFVFLSFGRRLVLKRWSQKFSFEYFNFCFCAAPRYKNTRALLIRKPNTRRARKKTAVFALPPPLFFARAFPSSSSSSSSSSSRFLLFCSPFSRVLGKVSGNKNRERGGVWREKRRLFVFHQLVFFCFSLSLALSFSFSASVLLLRVLVSFNETTTTVIFPS